MSLIEQRIQQLWEDILRGKSKYSIMRDLKQEGIEDERIKAIMLLLRNREIRYQQKVEEHYFRNLHYLFFGVLFITLAAVCAFYKHCESLYQYFVMYSMLLVGITSLLLGVKKFLRLSSRTPQQSSQ